MPPSAPDRIALIAYDVGPGLRHGVDRGARADHAAGRFAGHPHQA
jgi:hypothetical protein